MGIINPIYNEETCSTAACHAHPSEKKVLGVLDVIICLKEVDQQLSENTLELLSSVIVAILGISFIIGFFVRRWVDKPVRSLVEATNNVAIGNLSFKIEEEGKDELSVLKKSFNNMTKKLLEMRNQLVQSDKMASLGRLAAGVAHEINNPLTGVLTYSSFLLKRAGDNKELKEDLEVIVRETKRSREIVKGLLDFARQSTPKKGKSNINDIIDNAISVVTNQLKISHINLEKKLDPSLPDITLDANQIQQVIINLIVNSIDAINQSNGKITIETSTIELMPYGITQIRNAVCPKGHNLMDDDHKIDGMPSIKIKAHSTSNEGFIHLDPIYGRHEHHYGIHFDEDEEIKFHCPICGISLLDPIKKGPDNRTAVYAIQIPEMGELLGCTKYQCKWQRWPFFDLGGRLGFVEIKLADNGCGIPREKVSDIFEPFYTTKGQKGTGLGLAIVWGIIDNHRGKISVESEPEKGTTFTIRLPIDNMRIKK
ncbi:MAG: HAMP domain-containing protein [Bacteroidetes bacterium]|nr:HAMP domain-containing protein [Bacteroidota bacterium]